LNPNNILIPINIKFILIVIKTYKMDIFEDIGSLLIKYQEKNGDQSKNELDFYKSELKGALVEFVSLRQVSILV